MGCRHHARSQRMLSPRTSLGRATALSRSVCLPRATRRLARPLTAWAWLVRFSGAGKAEVDAAVVVLLCRSGQVQVGESDLLAMSAAQVVQRVPHNCVVRDFDLVAVFKDQYGLRLISCRCGVGLSRRIGWGVGLQVIGARAARIRWSCWRSCPRTTTIKNCRS